MVNPDVTTGHAKHQSTGTKTQISLNASQSGFGVLKDLIWPRRWLISLPTPESTFFQRCSTVTWLSNESIKGHSCFQVFKLYIKLIFYRFFEPDWFEALDSASRIS
jgi:hypothetical protein